MGRQWRGDVEGNSAQHPTSCCFPLVQGAGESRGCRCLTLGSEICPELPGCTQAACPQGHHSQGPLSVQNMVQKVPAEVLPGQHVTMSTVCVVQLPDTQAGAPGLPTPGPATSLGPCCLSSLSRREAESTTHCGLSPDPPDSPRPKLPAAGHAPLRPRTRQALGASRGPVPTTPAGPPRATADPQVL